LLQRECFWIYTLNTLSPLGLNGDFYIKHIVIFIFLYIKDVVLKKKIKVAIAIFILLYKILQIMGEWNFNITLLLSLPLLFCADLKFLFFVT